MKHVLITGGAGFIGSHIVDRLIKQEYRVRVFDNFDPQVHRNRNRPSYLHHEAEFVSGDVTDKQALGQALEGMDAIFHQAAAVGVGQSMYQIEHYVNVNTLGTAILLDLLVNTKHTIKKVIVAASMSSYGEGMYECSQCGTVRPPLRTDAQMAQRKWEPVCPGCGTTLKPLPTNEDAKQNSNSIYAITKRDQEEMVLTVCRAYGIPAVALRYFNVYGPRQSLSNPYTGVTAIFLSRLKNGNPPVVNEDGLQTRDFISVHDVADANLIALEKDAVNGVALNVGTGIPLTIKYIAEELARLLAVQIAPEITQKFRKGDVRHCFADIAKTKQMLSWQPRVSFQEGMRELIAWSRNEDAEDKFDAAFEELKAKGLA